VSSTTSWPWAYPPDLHDAHGGEILIHSKGWSKVHPETGIPNNPGYQIRFAVSSPGDREPARGWSLHRHNIRGTIGCARHGALRRHGAGGGTAAALAAKQDGSVRSVRAPVVQEALLHQAPTWERG